MFDFVARRQSVFDKMASQSAMLIASGHEKIRNRDVDYEFRPHSDFHYLTGFDEPDALLCLIKFQDGQDYTVSKTVVFVRQKDALMETWEGRRLGVDLAPEKLACDEAYDTESVDAKLAEILEGCQQLYISFSDFEDWFETVNELIGSQKSKSRQGVEAPYGLIDSDSILHEMRLHKSDSEISLMKRAAEISVQGHLAAMKSVKEAIYEFEVQASLESCFKRLGAECNAFRTIVASGENACILHYTENRGQIGQNSLVLVDAGAEYQGYAGDITTTFPANGRFTKPQADIYSLVLKAQQAAIQVIKPGIGYDEMHKAASETITQGLVELGVINLEELEMSLQEAIEENVCKKYFMHGTGHWLGRDVHDVGRYKIDGKWRLFEVGMVVTVEPGIYIAAEDDCVPEAYRGIGVRIEDDVLVISNGREVLTKGLPRTVCEIEAWMAENN